LANTDEITLTQETQPIDISPYMYFLEEGEARVEPSEIISEMRQPGGLQANPNWSKTRSQHTLMDTDRRVWMAFSISNSNAFSVNWLLLIDYALILDVKFYLVRENGDIEFNEIGSKYPFAQRPILHSKPLVPVYLAANERVWMIMSKVGLDSIAARDTQLWHELSFWQQQNERPLFQMLFNGAAVILLILIALGYLFSRDASYIYLETLLLAHLLTSIAHHGFLTEYLWPYPIPGWSEIKIALDSITLASIWLFADLFLNLVKRMPRLSKVFRILGYGLMIAGCLYSALPTSYSLDSFLEVFLGFARISALLFVGSLALYLWFKGSVLARNFFFVWLVYIVANLLMASAFLLKDPKMIESAGMVWDIGTLVVSLSLVIMLAQKLAHYREKEFTARAESQSKSEFLARMSHEIRTPLTGIIGMSEVLQNRLCDQENRNYAEIIKSSGATLLSIINDILDFSKIAANKMEVEHVDIHLPKLVHNIHKMFQLRAENTGIDFVSLVDSDVPEVIMGDPTRLSQIIINLLSNAFKFTHNGKIFLGIKVDKLDSDLIRVSVIDSGIGISPSAQSNIFESFSQAQSDTTRNYGGTGLGLAICKHLTELMGGEICVRSEEHSGSCFSFTLPLEESNEITSHNMEPLARIHLLLVDDDSDIREAVRKQVQHWNISVDTADSGEQALSLLSRSIQNGKHYNLIVTDSIMPNMSGIELIEKTRAIPSYEKTTTILLSASTELPSKQDQLDSGVTLSTHKPVHMIELRDIFCAALDSLTTKSEQLSTSNVVQMRSLDILVAEDNPVNCVVIKTMLKNLSHEVTLCFDGCEVLDAVNKKSYDLILMDCEMPNMDGYQATQKLRELEVDDDITRTPIIALTAHASQDHKDKCLACGMDGYVHKPITMDSIRAGIEAVLL